MPALLTAANDQRHQRTIHARRPRLRRGDPGSATAKGTRSIGDRVGKYEEIEVTAGLVNSGYQLLHSAAIIAFKDSATDKCGVHR